MTKLKWLKCCLLITMAAGYTAASAQPKADHVPCQEIPYLMQQYNADFRSVNRFYSPSVSNAFRGGGFGESGVGSPEKRERLEQLNKEYAKKLEAVNFKNLPQECKVDYILFKRDITEKLHLSVKEEQEYNKIKKWFPFADKIYA